MEKEKLKVLNGLDKDELIQTLMNMDKENEKLKKDIKEYKETDWDEVYSFRRNDELHLDFGIDGLDELGDLVEEHKNMKKELKKYGKQKRLSKKDKETIGHIKSMMEMYINDYEEDSGTDIKYNDGHDDKFVKEYNESAKEWRESIVEAYKLLNRLTK